MGVVETLLWLLYSAGAIFIFFISLLYLRELIGSIFYEDKDVIKTIREIVKPGSAREVFNNIAFGRCSQTHDRVKRGLYVLVDQKTGEVKIKKCSRPEDGLIASATRDA